MATRRLPPCPSLLFLVCSILISKRLCISPCLAASDVLGHAEWGEEKEEDDDDEEEVGEVQSRRGLPKECNFSVGEWVFDSSYPLYRSNCPFLSTHVNCQRNGRPDSDYGKWRWNPQQCLIPRFDALDFLGRIRRKRLMLVGDSIMRNQWESLVCLVEAVIPDERKTVTSHGPSMAFHALDFEVSIEFSWAPLLVELEEEGRDTRILHLDSIQENAKHWLGVDVLVFDSAHWWTHSGKSRMWNYYKEGEQLFGDLNPIVAYEKGLTTWARWVDQNLDPKVTRVIFRSVAHRHNRDDGWQCYKQREPLVYLGYTPRMPVQLIVLREVLNKMSFPVHLQDITSMSSLRQDGHPSIYTTVSSGTKKMHSRSDCSHWCLPGVPDAWNEMLSAILQ